MNRKYYKQSTETTVFVVLAVIFVLIIFGLYMSCRSCTCGQVEEETPVVEQNEPVNEIATAHITFPEGYNVMQIAQLLEENGVCSASDLQNTMNTTDFSTEFDFLPEFSQLEGRPYKLEGYLFPDTYDFYVPESADSIIRRFLNNFALKINDELIAACAETGTYYDQTLDLDSILTMASIVEREMGGVPAEMSSVAAVFYNRMKYPGGTVDGSATGGYFQSDVTKFYPYVYGTAPDGFVSEYNTFNVKGLPRGPICCPSLNAINAAIYPNHSNDAFFFYTDKNGTAYYAVTFDEHQANYQYCKDNDLVPTF